jgi:hypothetical protein
MTDESTAPYRAEDFITKAQLMTWLGITNNQRMSFQDKGLPFIRIGTVTLYHLPAACAWLKTRESKETP